MYLLGFDFPLSFALTRSLSCYLSFAIVNAYKLFARKTLCVRECEIQYMKKTLPKKWKKKNELLLIADDEKSHVCCKINLLVVKVCESINKYYIRVAHNLIGYGQLDKRRVLDVKECARARERARDCLFVSTCVCVCKRFVYFSICNSCWWPYNCNTIQ